MLYYFQGFI